MCNWLIKTLGGYTAQEFNDYAYRTDKLHEKELAERERILDEFTSLDRLTPDGCKRGPWCIACAFAKDHVEKARRITMLRQPEWRMTYCGKDEACKSFTGKER